MKETSETFVITGDEADNNGGTGIQTETSRTLYYRETDGWTDRGTRPTDEHQYTVKKHLSLFGRAQ